MAKIHVENMNKNFFSTHYPIFCHKCIKCLIMHFFSPFGVSSVSQSILKNSPQNTTSVRLIQFAQLAGSAKRGSGRNIPALPEHTSAPECTSPIPRARVYIICSRETECAATPPAYISTEFQSPGHAPAPRRTKI